MDPATRSYWRILGRALRLRCPRCGKGKLFRGVFKMHRECDVCKLQYEREPGFYLGSIYVNYGLTAVLTTLLYFWGFSRGVNENVLLGSLAIFCFGFPVLFFRHARAIWLAFDQFWDPQD
jgi:hypothetical protein